MAVISKMLEPSSTSDDTAEIAAAETRILRAAYQRLTKEKLKLEFLLEADSKGVATRGAQLLFKSLSQQLAGERELNKREKRELRR